MSCVATPTLTRTDVVTTNNLLTSFTPSVSTQPGQVVTSFEVVTCPPAGPNVTLACVPTSIPHVITNPGKSQRLKTLHVYLTDCSVAFYQFLGTVTTVQVPVVVTVPITSNQITTLYESSCVQVTNPSNPASPPSSTISSVLTTSTPPPLIITSQSSSTLADGSVTVLVLTSTSTLPPSAVFVSTSVPDTNQSSTSTPNHSTNLGAIIGGVVGGLFGLIGIIVLIWFILYVILSSVTSHRPILSHHLIANGDEDGTTSLIMTTQSRQHHTEIPASASIWPPTSSPNPTNMVSSVKSAPLH